MTGWICPRCQSSNAPRVTRCSCSPQQQFSPVPVYPTYPTFPIDPWNWPYDPWGQRPVVTYSTGTSLPGDKS